MEFTMLAAVFIGLPEVAVIIFVTALIVLGTTLRMARGKRKKKRKPQ